MVWWKHFIPPTMPFLHSFRPSLQTSDKKILSMPSGCQSPFCLNVPYIPGLASSSTPEPNVQRDRAMSKQQPGGSTWVSLELFPCKGPRPGEKKRGGRDAHGLWILQCAIDKRNPQNLQANLVRNVGLGARVYLLGSDNCQRYKMQISHRELQISPPS